MVHPQKRILVRKALESTMAHILELRSVSGKVYALGADLFQVLTKIKSTDWFDLDVILRSCRCRPMCSTLSHRLRSRSIANVSSSIRDDHGASFAFSASVLLTCCVSASSARPRV